MSSCLEEAALSTLSYLQSSARNWQLKNVGICHSGTYKQKRMFLQEQGTEHRRTQSDTFFKKSFLAYDDTVNLLLGWQNAQIMMTGEPKHCKEGIVH